MRVRHKHAHWMAQPIFGQAWGKTPFGKIRVRWDNPAVWLDSLIHPRNLVFIVPAGRRELPATHRPHEFLAKRPGSIVCICGCLKETTMHGYPRPEMVIDALTGAWRLARPSDPRI